MATTQGGGSGPGEELQEEEEEEEEEEVAFCAARGSAAEGSDGAAAGAVMTFSAQKCGICFQPPSIILIYRDNSQDKTRQRIMPVRNFSRFSDCSRAAEQLKNNPRHKAYLEGVSLRQLQKLYSLLRGHLEGQSLAESLEKFQQEQTIDPEEDMNKLDDKELAKRKSIMDELFEKNRKKKDDPDFVYNVEVEFPLDEQLESCTWDMESDEEI
ncbi:PREDICTED: centrosomal protein of 19 kDa [Ficedula albicollis]|uniref:Centrosomal protein of 19 kDa n=1 Tax=Ficedula albicollis TaxID=59894 RepID=A0A803VNU3_FICAL|nr:PREDICTED: centrosomal protein of 19 kDa [Ficedula albicollis]